MTDYKKQGRINRAAGAKFELLVRKDLEAKGWFVDKWTNNVDIQKENSEEVSGIPGKNGSFIYGKLIQAKNRWAGIGRPMMMGAGFPDFSCHKRIPDVLLNTPTTPTYKVNHLYEVIGVESKINGYLDKEEKEKCKWLLENNVFSKILIAKKIKIKNRVCVEYKEFVY